MRSEKSLYATFSLLHTMFHIANIHIFSKFCYLCVAMSKDKCNLLSQIDSPSDLKGLTISDLPQYCEEVRRYIVECCAENPGHLASSLGAVELAVALHYVYDTPEDRIVWDVGHQAYAHKIITGRRERFVDNRKAGGISGFPKGTRANMTLSVAVTPRSQSRLLSEWPKLRS